LALCLTDMTGEIISDVMTNGFFPSTMVQASTITGSQLAARVALPDAIIAQTAFRMID